MPDHSHLAPPLQVLRAANLAIWGDADVRRQALEAVVEAAEGRGSDLAAAVERVDLAVADGLAALGLPRGPVRAVLLESAPARWAGVKRPDSSLVLSLDVIKENVRSLARPDTTFRTWVHESIHARAPFAQGFAGEHGQFRGYEEGLVAEGLARLITREKAAMHPVSTGYDHYVMAYQTLAAELRLDLEQLWRTLWRQAPGGLRAGFGEAVAALCREQTERDLTPAARVRLQLVADRVFHSRRAVDRPDPVVLARWWGTARP